LNPSNQIVDDLLLAWLVDQARDVINGLPV
jgi:hypothetical protein